jgi:hypothetical protein
MIDKTHLIAEMIKKYQNDNNDKGETYEQFNITSKVDNQTALYLKSMFLLCDTKEDIEYCLNLVFKTGTLEILNEYFFSMMYKNDNKDWKGFLYGSNKANNIIPRDNKEE